MVVALGAFVSIAQIQNLRAAAAAAIRVFVSSRLEWGRKS